MTRTGAGRPAQAVPRIEKLHGCPGDEHVRWLVCHRAQNAPRAEPAALLSHVDTTREMAEFACGFVHDVSRGADALVEVTGWRRGRGGSVVVEYVDTRARGWDIRYQLAEDSRLLVPEVQPSLGGIDVFAVGSDELSGDDRAGVFHVFDATYAAADHAYLQRQLDRFDSVGLATKEGRVVGFYVAAIGELDLPGVEPQLCSLAGLSCVLPEVRRNGVMRAAASAAFQRSAVRRGSGWTLSVIKCATPASLNAAVRGGRANGWPRQDDQFALYDHPTPTQVAVARALAAHLGAAGYDEGSGACIGSGRPIGTPLVDADVSPDTAARFDKVDRSRGDSLLWLSWTAAPPDVWFT